MPVSITMQRRQVALLKDLVFSRKETAEQLGPFIEALQEGLRDGDRVRIEVQREGDLLPVLTPPQVAQIYGVSAQMVRRWCTEQKLPGAYKRPGGGWQIPATALAEATFVPTPDQSPSGALAEIAGLLSRRPDLVRKMLRGRANDEERELPPW